MLSRGFVHYWQKFEKYMEYYPVFPISLIRSRTQPIPIKEKTTLTKNGWFVLGTVRVTTFLIDD